jgi:hypothetical protein
MRKALLMGSRDNIIGILWVQLRITSASKGGFAAPCFCGCQDSDIIGDIYGVGGAAVFLKPPAAIPPFRLFRYSTARPTIREARALCVYVISKV